MMTPRIKTALFMAAACTLVVACGILGMVTLASSRQAPPHKPEPPVGLSVSAVPVEKTSVRLKASGYGQVAVVNVLEISPQVSGNIVEKHPSLEEGGRVEKGEVLFRIDETDYAIALDKARAEVKLDEAAIRQYRISLERDRDRLAAVQKNTQLARTEYDRLKTLYENDRVGTLSNVEAAEQSYNSLLDTEKNLKKTIALYPLQIKEAENELAKDRADVKTAALNLSRCTIPATFSGRIQSESVEAGAYMASGTSALTLADDRLLEIQVSLSDRDAFEVLGLGSGGSWHFSAGVDCRAESVTGNVTAAAPAEIHRIVRYDAETRTVCLAVRVQAVTDAFAGTAPAGSGLPLVDGMFCKVMFEGRRVEDAVKIPLALLNADDTVYLARGMKLKTLKVSQVTADDTHAWVTGAFETKDFLITSALSDPVENTLVYFTGRSDDKLALASGGGK